MIEAFLTKIAAVVFKKALVYSGFKALATVYEIYSVVDAISDLSDCVDSVNTCHDLGVVGVQVVSDSLTEMAVDRLLKIGSHSFSVEQTSSGVYVASRVIPTFRVTSPGFPTGVFAGGSGSFSSGGRGGFSSGGRGRFS